MPTRQSRANRPNGAGPSSDVRTLAAFHQSLILGAEIMHDDPGNDWTRAQCMAEAYKILIHHNGVPVPEWFDCDCCWSSGRAHAEQPNSTEQTEQTAYGPPREVAEPGAEPEVEASAGLEQVDLLDLLD